MLSFQGFLALTMLICGDIENVIIVTEDITFTTTIALEYLL